MGIPGILKEIGKGERIALSKLAVEHLERTRRPLRIAIDAAIWQFQIQAGQGGANPALRTVFYRLLRLLALPIHPVFVFDGKNKPLTKRGKTVLSYGSCVQNEMSKKLIQEFRFPHHTAPGEAEAECAMLQKNGIVDAVMSQDADAIMFGSTLTLRDWSKEGIRGNKAPTHVSLFRSKSIKASSKLDRDGMILVALLSGGDYSPDGVPGFGPSLACEIAKAGFGTDLLEAVRSDRAQDLKEWRDRLQYELETNKSGYFKTRHKMLRIPDEFPDKTILTYYTNPIVSSKEQMLILERMWQEIWDMGVDVPVLRTYTAEKFEWLYKTGAKKFIRCFAPSLLSRRLWQCKSGTTLTASQCIKERRQHFVSDGLPELRVEFIPADIVALDLDAEEENPGYAIDEGEEEDDESVIVRENIVASTTRDLQEYTMQSSPLKTRKSPPWDPCLPEKIWIPETIMKLGVPALVEEWEEKQREIHSDPKRFASRKCIDASRRKKVTIKDPGMKAGALHGFFPISKVTTIAPSTIQKVLQPPLQDRVNSFSEIVTWTPTKKQREKVITNDLCPKLDQYFDSLSTYSPQKPAIVGHCEREAKVATFNTTAATASLSSAVVQRPSTQKRSRDEPLFSIGASTKSRDLPQQRAMSGAVVGSIHNGEHTAPHSSEIAEIGKANLPAFLSTGLKSHFSAPKISGISRDSLPGTWKEFEDPVILFEDHVKKVGTNKPRISFVDLTGE